MTTTTQPCATSIDVESCYRLYQTMVTRRCQSMLGDPESAADASQEVFLKLLKNADRLGHHAPPRLLMTMATRVCLNRIRAQGRRPEVSGDEVLERCFSTRDVERHAVAREFVGRLMDRQKPSTQTIARLHLMHGMTLSEVSDEVGLSVSGIRKRLRKLRADVKRLDRTQSPRPPSQTPPRRTQAVMVAGAAETAEQNLQRDAALRRPQEQPEVLFGVP